MPCSPGERPTTPAIYWAVADNNKRQKRVVGVYEAALTDETLVIRRGTPLQITAYVPTQTASAWKICSVP